MNGPQDVGGRDGFGPVAPDTNEPIFHASWEPRAMAMTIAAGYGGHWTIDESRHMRENRNPSDYYSRSYYDLWITALGALLEDKGLVTAREIAQGQVLDQTIPPKRCLAPDQVDVMLARGGPVDRDPGPVAAHFDIGDTVRALNIQPQGHVRLPGYLRGATGRISMIHGYHVFADTSAQGDHHTAHWLYNVAFCAAEVFGDPSRAGDEITADLWEPYLGRS